jgi:hypothetical protein
MPEPRSGAPLLTAGQGAKEEAVNNAISILAALAVGSIVSDKITVPPTTLTEGDLYIIPTGATGAWATKIGQVAQANLNYLGGWRYYIPLAGWNYPITARGGKVRLYNGTEWVNVPNGLIATTPSTATLAATNNTRIPLTAVAASATTGDMAVASDTVTHSDGVFDVRAMITLTGLASAATGSVDVFVKAGATEIFTGVFDFTSTSSTKSVFNSTVLRATKTEPIEIIIKNVTAITSLSIVTAKSWLRVTEQ